MSDSGTNVNSTSVHRDCVEDAETLLSDICFNEDFYSKPPTVEFTVIDEVAVSSNVSGSSLIDDSIASLKARRSSTSDANSSISSSSRNISASGGNVLNVSAQRSNVTSSSSTSSTSASRRKVGRIPPAEPSEPSLKVAYSSGVEIPLDYSIGQEISIYTSGRNRKVYYGLNGAPYYITDTGTYIRKTPSLLVFNVISSLQIDNVNSQISRSYI